MSRDFSELLALITADQPDIDAILTHKLFNDAIRNDFQPLTSFLEQDLVIDHMASWCFDISSATKPEFHSMARVCLKLFTSVIPRVFEIFLYSNRLSEKLHEFLTSDSSKSCLLCGFFTRVMTQQIRWGDPRLFAMYDDTGTLLLARVRILAIQELIVLIATRPELSVFAGINLILELSKLALEDVDDTHCAFTIIRLYDELADDSPVFSQFFDENVVRNLVELCLASTSVIVSSDMMDIVARIVDMDKKLQPVVDLYKPRLLQPGVINQYTANALRAFDSRILAPFDLFFEPKGYIFIHYYCAQLLGEMSKEDLIDLAQTPGFLDKLMECFGTYKWCPHMTQLSIAFMRVLESCECFQYDKWTHFVENDLAPLVHALEAPFGGPVPESDEGSEYEEEEDEMDFSDEEAGGEDYEYEEDEPDIGMDDELETSDDEDDA